MGATSPVTEHYFVRAGRASQAPSWVEPCREELLLLAVCELRQARACLCRAELRLEAAAGKQGDDDDAGELRTACERLSDRLGERVDGVQGYLGELERELREVLDRVWPAGPRVASRIWRFAGGRLHVDATGWRWRAE